MATGTAQLLPPSSRHGEENDVSSSEEDVDGELPPPVPEPVKDGLPQVSAAADLLLARLPEHNSN